MMLADLFGILKCGIMVVWNIGVCKGMVETVMHSHELPDEVHLLLHHVN